MFFTWTNMNTNSKKMHSDKKCQLIECTRDLHAVNTILRTILYSSHKFNIFCKTVLMMHKIISIGVHNSLHRKPFLLFQLKLLD